MDIINLSFTDKRFETHPITVGKLQMGGSNQIRVQSMANTPTRDVEASINQAIEIFDAGAELVRFTAIDERDAYALRDIKNGLVAKGYTKPIVADVHFNAKLADIAAQFVDKVRINPGNYLEKRATFATLEFTDDEYQAELAKLNERLKSLIDICKEHHTALRIGTNHGSLSDRIMSRYGDTPAGMVEATMEFLRVCKKYDFQDVAVSLKSSNTVVMVQAYRLLVKQMSAETMNFPVHLGVTEAGTGTDGIIKSAVGIGTLLADGIGDTIRVSLTGSPAAEIAPARMLADHFESSAKNVKINYNEPVALNPFEVCRRDTSLNPSFDNKKPLVICDLPDLSMETLKSLGISFDLNTMTISGSAQSPDVLYFGAPEIDLPDFKTKDISLLIDYKVWIKDSNYEPLYGLNTYLSAKYKSDKRNWVMVSLNTLTPEAMAVLKADPTVVLIACSMCVNQAAEQRAIFNTLIANGVNLPVIVSSIYKEPDVAKFQLKSAADNGLFFIDGLANGLWLSNFAPTQVSIVSETAFTILQSARARYTKTEYIACPSCGRTLYDIEKGLAEVKKVTQHLTGLKIAVMGCIVNGPGEMADADYGYVGAGPGKVNLYKGKTLVKRGVDEAVAPQELLKMIEEDRKKA
ncbi:MAG: (E)-4-hydroxy-3-methylbut-2-enyl-diphosphate synthase [Salinivirgaceae bacterium]|nr:(E)-4-hydroxy-3-methylbut-2-enyl-diphosphate synthase [Salinivirgaceae bacterium]